MGDDGPDQKGGSSGTVMAGRRRRISRSGINGPCLNQLGTISRLQPAHRFAQQLRQFRNVRRDAPGLIAGEEL